MTAPERAYTDRFGKGAIRSGLVNTKFAQGGVVPIFRQISKSDSAHTRLVWKGPPVTLSGDATPCCPKVQCPQHRALALTCFETPG
jgi:hypothetical protein